MRVGGRKRHSDEVDLMTAAHPLAFIFFEKDTMKFAAAALLLATASAFTATSFQSTRSVATSAPAGVAFAPSVRLSQT